MSNAKETGLIEFIVLTLQVEARGMALIEELKHFLLLSSLVDVSLAVHSDSSVRLLPVKLLPTIQDLVAKLVPEGAANAADELGLLKVLHVALH
jgi:hypothetical protein